MGKYNIAIISAGLCALVSCSSQSEGLQASELYTEAEKRVRLHENETATIRESMDEQASEINRKRNIEEANHNNPAMRPPELRVRQMPHAPLDSAVHNNTEWLMPRYFRSRLIINR